MYSVHYTLYNVHCTFYTKDSINNEHSTVFHYLNQWNNYKIQLIIDKFHGVLAEHCITCVQCTVYTIQCTVYIEDSINNVHRLTTQLVDIYKIPSPDSLKENTISPHITPSMRG